MKVSDRSEIAVSKVLQSSGCAHSNGMTARLLAYCIAQATSQAVTVYVHICVSPGEMV